MLSECRRDYAIKLTLGENAEVRVSVEAARTSYRTYSAVVLKAVEAS